MPRCPGCPRAGLPCAGEAVPRLCELVDPSHPAYKPAYLAALDPARSGLAPATTTPLPAVLAALRRVRECPEAGPPSCSCDGARACKRFGRDVALQQCLECLAASATLP